MVSDMSRRRTNYIQSLKTRDGSLCSDQDELLWLKPFYRRFHFTRCNPPCYPKALVLKLRRKGGLGFKKLGKQNDAFLKKIACNLVLYPNQLWAQVLGTKYKWNDMVREDISRKKYSRLWRGISLIWNDVRSSLTWIIRNGNSIDFWKEPWLSDNEPLINQEILHQLMATMPPKQNQITDRPGWKWNPNRLFTVRSAYDIHTDDTLSAEDKTWTTIPKYRGIQRVKIFLWLIANKSVFTNRIYTFSNQKNEFSVLDQGRRLQQESIRARESANNAQQPGTWKEQSDPQWIPPPSAWLKTNIDGARDIQDGYAACGGAIRDSNGDWLIGFAEAVGICSALEAELWGAFEKNRDANKIADSLAKMAQKKEFAGRIFQTPPEAIQSILQEEGAKTSS
ncbi:hypothetical protein F3Y22_tig00013960pilonHSYRG00052 [Hibiscus syriacus]|uniref:RNase H type-1 domain-containing protein n=1 Tax=Hibiscus syriacus TaxID=106335 RepID=A0A6A3C5F7_HIBSY|nr:hypothetical protein F3Y22_tig00013960pilonHSYRG00052 [Hibiscus syriacus]